jgi:hypothetical protein
MKRVMAGEYSRELSTKVSVGQCRGAALGFWQGGPAGYGMRRQLIDENGNPKGQLEHGQRKSLQNDRVILVPGPQSEVKTIRRIFNSFVIKKKSRTQIAAELNADKIFNARGRRWIMQTVDDILTNEKYIGHSVYGRGSIKLGQSRVANPPDMWIRHDNAFKGIITRKIFAEAQKIRSERCHRLSDQEMLDSPLGFVAEERASISKHHHFREGSTSSQLLYKSLWLAL